MKYDIGDKVRVRSNPNIYEVTKYKIATTFEEGRSYTKEEYYLSSTTNKWIHGWYEESDIVSRIEANNSPEEFEKEANDFIRKLETDANLDLRNFEVVDKLRKEGEKESG